MVLSLVWRRVDVSFSVWCGDRAEWLEKTPNKYRQMKEHKNGAVSSLIAIQNDYWVRFSHVNALTVTLRRQHRTHHPKLCGPSSLPHRHTRNHTTQHNATTHSDSIYIIFFAIFPLRSVSLLCWFTYRHLMLPKRCDSPEKICASWHIAVPNRVRYNPGEWQFKCASNGNRRSIRNELIQFVRK